MTRRKDTKPRKKRECESQERREKRSQHSRKKTSRLRCMCSQEKKQKKQVMRKASNHKGVKARPWKQRHRREHRSTKGNPMRKGQEGVNSHLRHWLRAPAVQQPAYFKFSRWCFSLSASFLFLGCEHFTSNTGHAHTAARPRGTDGEARKNEKKGPNDEDIF